MFYILCIFLFNGYIDYDVSDYVMCALQDDNDLCTNDMHSSIKHTNIQTGYHLQCNKGSSSDNSNVNDNNHSDTQNVSMESGQTSETESVNSTNSGVKTPYSDYLHTIDNIEFHNRKYPTGTINTPTYDEYKKNKEPYDELSWDLYDQEHYPQDRWPSKHDWHAKKYNEDLNSSNSEEVKKASAKNDLSPEQQKQLDDVYDNALNSEDFGTDLLFKEYEQSKSSESNEEGQNSQVNKHSKTEPKDSLDEKK